MYKIQTLNHISDIIHNHLTAENYLIAAEEPVPDGILVRSADMHKMELPESLLAVARAGAGTNNIPIDECTKQGILVDHANDRSGTGCGDWIRASRKGRISLTQYCSSIYPPDIYIHAYLAYICEHGRADAFTPWCWRRLLRVHWTAGRSNQSILKEVKPEYLLELLMLKLKFQ